MNIVFFCGPIQEHTSSPEVTRVSDVLKKSLPIIVFLWKFIGLE
jgi:hypothetical protein